MGTLTDATEGMLQDGGDGSGCVKVVVRENEITTVVAAPSTDTVVCAPNAAVVARSQTNAVVAVRAPVVERVVAQQTETIVASSGCGSGGATGPSGPADWNTLLNKPATFLPDTHAHSYDDLTDVPTEFTPAPHVHALLDVTGIQAALDAKAAVSHSHAISDVAGLEPRLFVTGTSYTFDIDITNADEGVTDPYKFKTAYAAVLDILALIPQLPLNGDNTITMLLGNGDHQSWAFAYLFSFGAGGGYDSVFLGLSGIVAHANCRFIITAKSTPSAISTGEWSAVTSSANYGAEIGAKSTANRALIVSRFPCRIVATSAIWQSYYLFFPKNARLDGVAVLSDALYQMYLSLPSIGVKRVAAWGTTSSYADASNPAVPDLNRVFNAFPYNEDGAVIYVVDGEADMHSLAPSASTMSLSIINPSYAVNCYQNATDNSQFYVWLTLILVGAMRFEARGWIAIAPRAPVYLFFQSGTSLKSGQVALSIYDSSGAANARQLYIDGTSTSGTGAIIRNMCRAPIITYNYSQLIAKHSIVGGFISMPGGTYDVGTKNIWGTGAPNGVVFGAPGDTYTNKSGGAGTTLYIKESGVNTNTGWVAK